jgi:hypothetical protein
MLPPLSSHMRAWWGLRTMQPAHPLSRSSSSIFGVEALDSGAFAGPGAGLSSGTSPSVASLKSPFKHSRIVHTLSRFGVVN